MSKIIVMMGAPGAGKGTQARLLQERVGLPQISTGDMFRALKTQNTPLAQEVQAIMNSGKLVPDEVTSRVVAERTAQPDCAGGYVLDGYPRTIAQAETLEQLAIEQHQELLAVTVDVPFELLEQRTSGRRSCPVCGEIYNVYFKPPQVAGFCDLHPDAPLTHRSDDMPEKVKVRLATYEGQTKPLIEYYEQSDRLQHVDGTRSLEEVYGDVISAIGIGVATA